MDGQRNGQLLVCPSSCLSVCVFECVEAEAWHLSGWGAYENIGPNPGQISTSVIIAVVTDSQTLKVRFPPPSSPAFHFNKITKKGQDVT